MSQRIENMNGLTGEEWAAAAAFAAGRQVEMIKELWEAWCLGECPTDWGMSLRPKGPMDWYRQA